MGEKVICENDTFEFFQSLNNDIFSDSLRRLKRKSTIFKNMLSVFQYFKRCGRWAYIMLIYLICVSLLPQKMTHI